MYLRRLRIRNYMVHQDTALSLFPLTVLVGPNNGGKSALFDAILNFSMLSRGNIRQAFGPYPFSFNATRYHGASNVARIGFSVEVAMDQSSEEYLSYEIDYAQQGTGDAGPTFSIFNETVRLWPENRTLFDRSYADNYDVSSAIRLENDRSVLAAIRLARVTSSPVDAHPLLLHLTEQVSKFNKFRLDPAVLAAPSRIPDTDAEQASSGQLPRIGYLGEDLAATLYYLNAIGSPVLNVILQKVQEIEPTFDGFDFSSVGADKIAFSARFADQRGATPSVRLSSGLLIYLGLITLVSTPNRPTILMIEEPENGLTPQAQKAFYQSLRSLAFNARQEDRSQVLISSHSPFVICEAWNGEDRSFIQQIKVVDGKARIKSFQELVQEHHIPLSKDEGGERTHMSLKNAEDVMSGRFS